MYLSKVAGEMGLTCFVLLAFTSMAVFSLAGKWAGVASCRIDSLCELSVSASRQCRKKPVSPPLPVTSGQLLSYA